MRLRVAMERGEPLEETLGALLDCEPYLAYANFSPVAARPGALREFHARQWRRAAAGLGVWVARDDDRPVAALGLEQRDFESAHFGMRIAKIDAPLAVADEGARQAALRALYPVVVGAARERGYEHLSLLASTQDRAAGWTMQEAGGFYVGTKISWMQELTGRPRDVELPTPLRIEVFDRSTAGSLDRAAWRELLEWADRGFDRGPFVFDLNVPLARALGLYAVWTEKAMTGEWADALLVVRDGEKVVSFHSMMRMAELSEAAGVGIVGRGIGASLPGYRGLFTVLQKETSARRPLGASYLENEAQASTVQSIQVFGKLGHRCLRSTANFHARLGGKGSTRRAGAGE